MHSYKCKCDTAAAKRQCGSETSMPSGKGSTSAQGLVAASACLQLEICRSLIVDLTGFDVLYFNCKCNAAAVKPQSRVQATYSKDQSKVLLEDREPQHLACSFTYAAHKASCQQAVGCLIASASVVLQVQHSFLASLCCQACWSDIMQSLATAASKFYTIVDRHACHQKLTPCSCSISLLEIQTFDCYSN